MKNWLVGAYGPDMNGSARGITRLRSLSDGSLEADGDWLIEAESPAFLAHAGKELLVALEGRSEIARVRAASTSLDDATASGGVWPCHIGVYDGTVVVANYFTGTLGVLNQSLTELAVLEPVPGSGPTDAQDGPHAHATVEISPGIILSADLGADRIHVHHLREGVLTRGAAIALNPGFGPRDFLLVGEEPADRLLYVLGEHASSVLVTRWTGSTLEILSETALPGAESGDFASALVVSGGRLYAGLRGSNRVAVLGFAGTQLEPITSVSCAGEWPRHLVADGDILHVANQLSNTVASFSLTENGVPSLIAQPTAVASPTYLLAD